jgi:hypothetical protein
VACSSEADCVAAGTTGPCDKRGSGALRKPNVCDGNRCADTGDGIHGRCETGPTDTYCDGVLFAHGTPYLPCLSNADCNETDAACDGDCGECTLAVRRSCFLDPIVTSASAGPSHGVLAGISCVPPGASAALDQVAGIAGPERTTLDVRLRRVFPEDLAQSGQ